MEEGVRAGERRREGEEGLEGGDGGGDEEEEEEEVAVVMVMSPRRKEHMNVIALMACIIAHSMYRYPSCRRCE